MGRIDPAFVVHETAHWIVNHGMDAVLPGYLMVGARTGADFEDLPAAALAELGPLLALSTSVIRTTLGAERVYAGRFGHSPGWPVHFHLIPVHPWLVEEFQRDPSYDAVRALCNHGRPDGADLTLFVWREWTRSEGRVTRTAPGPSVGEAIGLLRAAFLSAATPPDGGSAASRASSRSPR
jgi:diadenosine tetraphosphate (Ap4A) HIT family hydrolase